MMPFALQVLKQSIGINEEFDFDMSMKIKSGSQKLLQCFPRGNSNASATFETILFRRDKRYL